MCFLSPDLLIQQKSQLLDKYLSNGLLNSFSSVHEMTQTLRGTDFIYLDGVLQHEYSNPKEEFPASVDYFLKHFKLYIQLLKMIPEFLPDVNLSSLCWLNIFI